MRYLPICGQSQTSLRKPQIYLHVRQTIRVWSLSRFLYSKMPSADSYKVSHNGNVSQMWHLPSIVYSKKQSAKTLQSSRKGHTIRTVDHILLKEEIHNFTRKYIQQTSLPPKENNLFKFWDTESLKNAFQIIIDPILVLLTCIDCN